MVYGIIKQHRGFIDVYSEIDQGSTFNIYIPAYDVETGESTYSAHQGEDIPHGEGLILVVDDEEVIRITAKSILEECGYTVFVTKGGQEALLFYEKHHHEISAVLLDMIMPDLSGKEVFARLKEINREVRVLLSSGFKKDGRVEEVINNGVKGFIQKPYSMKELARKIHSVIYE